VFGFEAPIEDVAALCWSFAGVSELAIAIVVLVVSAAGVVASGAVADTALMADASVI